MALDKFLKYLEYERRYSKHTLKAYHTDISQFGNYLNTAFENDAIDTADHFQIRSWIVDLMQSGISERSVNRKIASLSSYYRFCLREQIIDKNPMVKIQGPKLSKTLPAFVEKGKMDLVFEQLEFEDNYEGRRNRLILSVFYETGMRLSELNGLKTSDFDSSASTLRVLGKRNKERMIPLMAPLAEQIKTHLKEVNGDYLFSDKSGKALNQKYIYRMVRDKLGSVTSAGKRSPHILRHTFATHMLENGADINAIKELLGHASLAATQVYTHNTIEKLKSVHKQAHPKS